MVVDWDTLLNEIILNTPSTGSDCVGDCVLGLKSDKAGPTILRRIYFLQVPPARPSLSPLSAPDRACGDKCLVFGDGDLGLSGPLPSTRCSRTRNRPGWFRHYQHRHGQTGGWVEGQALRPLQRDVPSQGCNQVSGVSSQYDTRGWFAPVRASATVEQGIGSWAHVSVTGGRSSGSHRRLGIGRADVTLTVANRTTHSWEQTIGL